MNTECTAVQLEFPGVGRRRLVARFDGGAISSDAGALLLKAVEARTGLLAGAARCFVDHRDPQRIEHSVEELVSQRVVGLASQRVVEELVSQRVVGLGYEDLNDHDELRHDALLASVVGKEDPTGSTRVQPQDRGKALAGKSTLNRLELTPDDASGSSRYKKIVADESGLDALFVEQFVSAHERAPVSIVLDVDATDDPLHGHQEGRFFHGYYRSYCYLPLYIFCGEQLLCARLRPSNIDGAAGTVEELERIIAQIRRSWPQVQIIVRGDSGFCREELMGWCEANEVDYVLGLAKNTRLIKAIEAELEQARELHESTAEPARVFRDFIYATRKSWSRSRRVVGKAEHLSKGANPRFIVTSLSAQDYPAKALYEELYCARGDMENRIKEQQLALFADRTSTATMRATALQALRRLGLKGTTSCGCTSHRSPTVRSRRCAGSGSKAPPWRTLSATPYGSSCSSSARRCVSTNPRISASVANCHGTQYLGLVLPELSVRRAVHPHLP